MATSENAAASTTTTKDSRKTPDLKHHATDIPDTEMTIPLASTDELVLVEKDKMFNNSFESANARHARMRGISNGQNNIKNEAEDINRAVHQPWRRSDGSAPAYGATTSGVTSQSSGYIPQNGTGVPSAGDGSYAGQFYSPSAPSATPAIHPFPPYNPLTHGQYPNPVGYASDGVPADQVLPGPVFPSMNQLTHAWCYGMYRGNGQYTMLIPADELPEGFGIPRRQGPEGMIIAPAPRSTPPNFNNASKMVPPHVVSSFPVYDPSAPETKEPGQLPPEQLQAAIDTIVARNPQQYMNQAAPMMRSKREKEYCDKWIHEGTCAFVQQGCKYKHEMPDPNTSVGQAKLRELGLYNGLPKWYRNMLKEQEEASRVQFKSNPDFTNPPRALAPAPGRSSVTPARGGNRHTGGHWRESRPVPSPTPSSSEKSTILAGRKSYGPIEPPRQGNAGPPRYSGNTFASLASLDSNMDNDDDSEEGGIKL